MRTLLLVVLMTLMALASGLSFVVHAAAEGQASAEMEVGCGPGPVVASGEPTLLSCTAVARNTGAVTLSGAQLEFLPAADVPPPDVYVFWSETHNGLRSAPSPVQVMYDFGDIAPGASNVIGLEIIVRSTHDFGADVALVAQPDQREYSRTPIRGTVERDGGAVVPGGNSAGFATLTREFNSVMPNMTSAVYRLEIMNPSSVPYDDVSLEMSPGVGVVVSGAIDWKRGAERDRFVADFGALGGPAIVDRAIRLATANDECATATPAIVVTTRRGGEVFRQPLIDDGVLLGACTTIVTGAGTLPQSGSGPSRGGGRLRLTSAALATIGALCLAMGATTRRRRRGSASEVKFLGV